jgi:hypothetical protein
VKGKIGYFSPKGGRRVRFEVRIQRGSPTKYTKYTISHHPLRAGCRMKLSSMRFLKHTRTLIR